MGRSHAWIKRGQELSDPRPSNWGGNLTMIGAVRLEGWVTLRAQFQSANQDRFGKWVRRYLAPKLRQGDIVIMDNAWAHKRPDAVEHVQAVGARIKFLPPYSPDMNPIEPAWAIVKKFIKAKAPRAKEWLRRAAHAARHRITPLQLWKWFQHSGCRPRRK